MKARYRFTAANCPERKTHGRHVSPAGQLRPTPTDCLSCGFDNVLAASLATSKRERRVLRDIRVTRVELVSQDGETQALLWDREAAEKQATETRKLIERGKAWTEAQARGRAKRAAKSQELRERIIAEAAALPAHLTGRAKRRSLEVRTGASEATIRRALKTRRHS